MQCKLEPLDRSPRALGRAAADDALGKLFRNALLPLGDNAGKELKVISEGSFLRSAGRRHGH